MISIQAPWGDGKTTLKEMVVNLEETEGKREKLLFVHFNPWEWAAQNQVVTAFFHELGAQVGFEPKSKADAARAKTIQRLLLKMGALVQTAEVIAMAGGAALEPSQPEYAQPVGWIARWLGQARGWIDRLGKGPAAAESSVPPSIEAIKRELRNHLQAHRNSTGLNILVFIDDIDRLSGDEIRQVLQLVKINADFPGLIFVLLFDKEYVERRLRRHFGSDAARFLEKIVQVELTLPKASEDQLYQCFRRDVVTVLDKRHAYPAIFEEDRLKQAFEAWFRFHLVNPRKSGRLLSSWAFRLDVFDTGAAEVNPVDLLILEGFALYEPEVYQELSRAYGDLFPEPYRDLMDMVSRARGQSVENVSERMRALNRTAQKARETTWLEVAAALKLLLGVEGGDFADVGTQETSHRIRFCRFSEARFFRRYFRLSIDSGDVSKATIQKLVKSVARPKDFLTALTELEQQGTLLDALDQLMAEDFAPPTDIVHFFAHLLDWWEERILRRGSDKQDTGLTHSMIRLYEQVVGTREGRDRSDVLQAMLKQTNSVFALGDLVFHEQGKRHRRMESKSTDTTGILAETGEREICDEVARRLAGHFRNHVPAGRPYEVEACWWALRFGGSWRPDIGNRLILTAGGILTLLRATLGRFGELTQVNERLVAARLIVPMVDFETLCEAVKVQLKQLIDLEPRAADWPRELDRIREAVASGDGEKVPEGLT